MKLRKRISRRWRSVSFRSGLWSALAVGVVAALAVVVVTLLVFAIFVLTSGVEQISLVDRAQDQLELGVEPQDLDLEQTFFLEDLDRDPREQLTSNRFWVVLAGDQVLNSDGEVDQGVIDAAFSDPGSAADIEGSTKTDDLVGIKRVDGQDWFYIEREVQGANGTTYRVAAAFEGTFSLRSFVRDSLPITIPLLLILMVVAMAVTSWLTRRALRRVERMRSEVELITQQSLDRRVPVVDASDDIEKLGHTMNDMLERLETSNAQQAQFIADASHELRSPVAGLLAQLDVATAYPDKVDAASLLPKLRNEAERLQSLVNDLLFLSRSEMANAAEPAASTLVEVDALISTEVAHQLDIDPSVNIERSGLSNARVNGNPSDLARALRNLVANAVRHRESIVSVDVAADDGYVVISVRDDGPGIAAEDRDRIFQRFVRLDEARTRDAGGSGLGLAIAAEIAQHHGGSVDLRPGSEAGSTFELRILLQPDATHDHPGDKPHAVRAVASRVTESRSG